MAAADDALQADLPAGDFEISAAVCRVGPIPYERRRGDPLYRPLRVFVADPSHSPLEGGVATLQVPYEPLQPGPRGALFEVDTRDGELDLHYQAADLDAPGVLIADGYEPALTDPRFHQQMVYAVSSKVYEAFRTALGREVPWSFALPPHEQARLCLQPHAGRELNAWYEKSEETGEGRVRFGYFPSAELPRDRISAPGGYVFTCLSHDVIVHELTHALLDGLRSQFLVPTSPDVLAFHEAFADLVALFLHFSYPEALRNAIGRARGQIAEAGYLVGLAQQVGFSAGHAGALRGAIDRVDAQGQPQPRYGDPASIEPHERGAILVAAVFDAFLTVYRRKTARLLRLATSGSGLLPPGELSTDLREALTDIASRLAGHFLNICIRAIDYCPPIGLEFGDYLRALVTVDHSLFPDDPWGYREALIEAFRRRAIYPRGVAHLSEEALRWQPPCIDLPPLEELSFARLRFRGDPARAADCVELRRQAWALGRYLTATPRRLEEFGLVRAGDPVLEGDEVSRPCISSIRSCRRSAPGGRMVFDLVAEITQWRQLRGDTPLAYPGGCTVILGPDGDVRYLISKSVSASGRAQRRREFVASAEGQRYWERAQPDQPYRPRGDVLRQLHLR